MFVGTVVAQTDTSLTVAPDTAQASADQRSAAFTVSASELDAELNSQDVSGVLQSSRDIFNSTAGFTFGAARFRIRGFDGENTLISLNGVLMNDLESGFASFSNWGGLNDVTRWLETRTGVTSSRYNFGGVGGYSEISLRASELRRGTRFSYALTNRAYTHRLMGTHNTGMMANGWAFSISGSRRWANEGYVPGTFYDAGAYFVSAEKKLNARHSIAFTGLGAPVRQGRQTLAIQEAYDLTGDNYYNPSWGYQAGEKRNSRVSFDHKPILLLTHIFTPDDSTEWTTTALYSFGRDGNTNLNWFDARDPRPDYYRYFPSYYDQENTGYAAELTSAWQNNVNTQQIDWDQLYFANGKNLYTVLDAEGISGNNVTGLRSKYIVEDQRTDPTRIALNTVWSREMQAGYHLTAGASWNKQRTHNYKVLNDLLGGEFWVDLNQFAELDSQDPNGSQQNLDTPNHVVREGDTFGYDYDIHTQLINAFGQVEKKWQRVEGYAGLSLSQTSFWRESRFTNGLFPETSKGESPKQTFSNIGVKAGAVYKVDGRNYITGNAAFITRPPTPRTAFISPRTRETTITGLTNESVLSGDISYLARMPRLKGRATLYYAQISNQLWSRSYFNEQFLTLVNYAMTGVDQTHMGLELGLEAKLSPTVTATAVLAQGQYRYSSRPTATITRDNLDTAIATGRTVYWKNYRVGGMPQTAASVGAQYNSPKFWRVGANVNYFGNIYLDPNPDRRTAEALTNLVTDDPQWDQLLDQTKLDDGYTIDVFFYKSWLFKRKYRLGLNASISNLLDNQELRTGGFEQLRYERLDPDKFPPKYGYMFGRTYFLMLTYSF